MGLGKARVKDGRQALRVVMVVGFWGFACMLLWCWGFAFCLHAVVMVLGLCLRAVMVLGLEEFKVKRGL